MAHYQSQYYSCGLGAANKMNYIVRGLTASGAEMFYTGRAGERFINSARSEAFGYTSLDAARAKAKNLNRMTALHGVWFIGMPAEGSMSLAWLMRKAITSA